MGPELLSAASDNDPTNVGTAAVVGAQTGYSLSWVVVLIAPLLAVTQSIAAQVAIAGRGDLQTQAARRYGRRLAAILMVSVLVVNVVTIAADVQAGAAGIGLLAGLDPRWLVLPLGLALIGVLLVGKYDELVGILRWLLIGFFAFGAAAALAHPAWSRLARSTFLPVAPLQRRQLAGVLALLGTTLTSYVYVWETIERGVEEPPAEASRAVAITEARFGAVLGAVFTALILWFMLVASAATLGAEEQPSVPGAAEAARALRPLAGSLAVDLYAAGLLVSAVVALAVLMATTAPVVGAQFDWRGACPSRSAERVPFYSVLAVSIGIALIVTLSGVSVLRMLLIASILGAFGTPLGLVIPVRLARDPEVMGELRISRGLAAAGWTVAMLVSASGLALIAGAAFGAL
jgi:Mn2+/Fe2+ NRAMP family transporter